MVGRHTVGLEKRWIFSRLIIDDLCCIDGTGNKQRKLQKWTDFPSETLRRWGKQIQTRKTVRKKKWVEMSKTYELQNRKGEIGFWRQQQPEENEWRGTTSINRTQGHFFRSIHTTTVLSPSKPSISAAGVSTRWLFGDDALILLSLTHSGASSW